MVKNIRTSSDWVPPETVDLFKSLEKVQLSCTPDIVAAEINALEPGDTFAMYIHRQNCAIIVYMPKNQKVKAKEQRNVMVATFPGELPAGEIYKHESDIEVNDF